MPLEDGERDAGQRDVREYVTTPEPRQARIEREPSARVDYIEFFDPETLTPVAKVTRGVRLALAVFIGKTRLIDNTLV